MTEEEEARAALRAQEARVGSVEQSLGKATAVFEMVAGRMEQLQTRLKRHDAEMAAVKRQHEEAMRQRYEVSQLGREVEKQGNSEVGEMVRQVMKADAAMQEEKRKAEAREEEMREAEE